MDEDNVVKSGNNAINEVVQETNDAQVEVCDQGLIETDVTALTDIEEEDVSDVAFTIRNLLASQTGTITWYEQDFDFNDKPCQLTGAWKTFLSDAASGTKNNFTKGCKWAPDGSCIITNSEDQTLRVFDLPQELLSLQFDKKIDCSSYQEMVPALSIKESELTYDYAWYPSMSSADPATCCFITTCKNQPVHLWDAFTGQLRSTYRAYDHLDEIVAAHSLAFDPYGQHIYCGYNKMIRTFDLAVPGRDFTEIPTKSKTEGQTGIISSLAVNPANHRIIAAGAYCKTVGLYLEPRGEKLCVLAGQGGGVTHLIFSPDGTKLFSGGRKDSEILCWDIRNPGKILYILRRTVATNQRIYFDLSRDGRYIISGNTNGIATIWDTNNTAKDLPGVQEPVLEPIKYFQAHNDCVNGARFVYVEL